MIRTLLACLLLAAEAWAQPLPYRVVTDPAESARGVALELLKHLAAGELDAAAALSNAPERRLEVLRDFQRAVGDAQFRRLFGQYFSPANRIVMEAAIGRHRLLIWQLGEAGDERVGQYFVEVDGRFLLDDRPSAERSELQRVLEAQRRKKSGSGS